MLKNARFYKIVFIDYGNYKNRILTNKNIENVLFFNYSKNHFKVDFTYLFFDKTHLGVWVDRQP